MDDLIQHCLRELAFEGDYGCNVQRLHGFIRDFYSSDTQPVRQNVDAAFLDFAWSALSCIPSVKIGLKPVGQHIDVFVPSQPKKKDKGLGSSDGDFPGLEEIPHASTFGLAHLTEMHGPRLRVAVDSERCFVAITGSHTRSGKLTPMVYAALQLVAKARDAGLGVLDLGRSLGIDQKTCFHFVKQLVELDLVVKLRRGGNTQNFCVHKFFYERSSMWKDIRLATEPKAEGEDGMEPSAVGDSSLPTFSPMGSVHLSNLDLLRQRVVLLLKSSIDETQPYVNLCLKVGYTPRQRTDRRFFLNRLLELVKEGIIEIVHQDGSVFNIQPQKFVRLARPSDPSNVDPALIVDEEESMVEGMMNEGFVGLSGLASNKTLQRQVVELIQGSGTTGITISELSDRLGSFDKRIISLLLSRLERQPPPHLTDLGIVQTVEFHFREKRFRYFTSENAAQLASTLPDFELSHELPPKEALENAMGYRNQDRRGFYGNDEELAKFYNKWNGKTQGRPRLLTTPKLPKTKKEKQAPKEKKWTNPILPDGTRKRGRPLKKQRGRKKVKTCNEEVLSEDEAVEVQSEVTEAPLGSLKRKRLDGSDDGDDGVNPMHQIEAVDGGQELQLCDETRESVMENEISAAAHPPELTMVERDSTTYTKRTKGRPRKRRKVEEAACVAQAPDLLELPTSEAEVVSLNEQATSAELVARIFPVPAGERHDDPEVAGCSAPASITENPDGITHKNASEPPKKSFLDSLRPFEEELSSAERTSRQGKRSARNLTALRRENEILRVLDRCGGIVNTSGAEFLDMCREVREAAINAGETASAPVTATMDRRTLNYSLDKLSSQGKIKLVTTTFFSSSHAQRTAKIIHLPTTSDDSIRDFIASQSTGRLPAFEGTLERNEVASQILSANVVEKLENPCISARRILDLVDEGERFKQLFKNDDSVMAGGRPVKGITELQKSMVFDSGEEQAKPRKNRKSGSGKREGDGKIHRRRQRFKWTDELDELARDAQAIIAVRCGNRRTDYGALNQVFPTIPHTSVRRRINILYEQPGEEAYFKRLLDAWALLWQQKRGSPELPDADPSNLTRFDLPAHIEYLRKHVDKTAIRVGVSVDSIAGHQTILYADPDIFARDWHLEVRGAVRAIPDFLLDTITEEAREKAFCDYTIIHAVSDSQDTRLAFAQDSELFSEAVLKMVVGSPDDGFDSSTAAEILQKIGDERVARAINKLLSENVLSKVTRDSSRLGPGRSVKIAESNLSALEGPLPKDVFEKALEVKDSCTEEIGEAQTWPFIATEGETAAILQMVSDHAANFSFDCSRACEARKQVENSRKADDDDIELGIEVNVDPEKIAMSAEKRPPLPTLNIDVQNLKHGITGAGDRASCKFSGIGVVDCSECVEDITAHLLTGLGEGADTIRMILTTVDSAGEVGLNASETRASFPTIDSTMVATLLHSLHTGPSALIHVVGYDSPTYISTKHVGSRTVTSTDDVGRLVKFFPRRWFDIRGRRVQRAWEAALRAVMGELFLNPGTSQYNLRMRFSSIYDRAELVEILDHLNGNGLIHYKAFNSARLCIECLNPEEEQDVFWFVNSEKHWYDL